MGSVIRSLMMLGWLTLPLSNLKWLPELGVTRPLCSLFFSLALGMIFLLKVRQQGFSLISLSGWGGLYKQLRQQAGWEFLRWWVIMIIIGLLSAAITPFYGVPLQALNRLLGYALIFIFLYSALYSLQVYRMETIARWISLGYAPVLPYAIIEAIATQKVYWAVQIVKWVRNTMIVPYRWVERTAFLTTEPSFLSFQLILLIAIFPFLKSRVLRITNILLFTIAIFFSLSGMLGLIILGYGICSLVFSLRRSLRVWLIAALSSILLSLGAIYRWSLAAQEQVEQLTQFLMSHINRLDEMQVSVSIRVHYILNLVYTLFDTYGIGLGIGQYGHFWKEIYLRHIDYSVFDRSGEVAYALKASFYMRPWSVVLGIGVDLGVLGMALMAAFLYQIFRAASTRHARSIVMVSFFVLLGAAYPIVMPHVWLTLGLMGGCGLMTVSQEDI